MVCSVVSPRNPAGFTNTGSPPHAELLRGVAAGDERALASLFDATSRTVYGLLLRILSDACAAEEVLLDVYAQAWRQAKSYTAERGSPMAWLVTIARSRAIDRLRRSRQERERSEPFEAAARHAAPGAGAEEEAAAR